MYNNQLWEPIQKTVLFVSVKLLFVCTSKIVIGISNIGSVFLNWISRYVKDYYKNSSDSRLVLENLKPQNNHRLVTGNLNINSISDNLKLII